MRDLGTCRFCGNRFTVESVQRDPFTGRYPGGTRIEVRCWCGTHPDSKKMVKAIYAEIQGESRSRNHWNPRPYSGSSESKRFLNSFRYRAAIALMFVAPVVGFGLGWGLTLEVIENTLLHLAIAAAAAFLAWLGAVGVYGAVEMPYKRRWEESERRRVARNEQVRREREERGDRAYVGLTQAMWRNLLSEFDQRCAYCSKPLAKGDTHRDHFVPFSKGGVDDASNIVPACGDCNRAKRDRMPDDWLAQCRREKKKSNPKLKEWRLGKARAE